MSGPKVNATIDHLFRHESGRMISVLSKLLGIENLETAQDIVQDSLLKAMTAWSYYGLPDNPKAWLYKTARNKAIDYLRRNKKFREVSSHHARLLESEYATAALLNQLFFEEEIQDGQLRMIFACCHPAIPEESRIALSLKILCGLNITEIARAFLSNEETISKRIYRAKDKIKTENVTLDLPAGANLPQRLDSVLRCLYLLFNEGYNSSHPNELIRHDLCEEAMRLCYLLTQHSITNAAKTQALLSLICFQSSRLQARMDDKGNIILLKYQDRNKWYKPLVQLGFSYLDLAVTEPFETSVYHLEAAIASLHASAKSFEETDWEKICFLYQRLFVLNPSPIIRLNQGIASFYAGNRKAALKELKAIEGLDGYYIYYASLGEIQFELGEKEEARNYFYKALQLTPSKKEHQLLSLKIEKCLEG